MQLRYLALRGFGDQLQLLLNYAKLGLQVHNKLTLLIHQIGVELAQLCLEGADPKLLVLRETL